MLDWLDNLENLIKVEIFYEMNNLNVSNVPIPATSLKISARPVMLFGLPDITNKKLDRLQHTAARLVLNRGLRESATEILKELHWLPIRSCTYKLGSCTNLHYWYLSV